MKMLNALEMIKKGDLTFVDDLYSKVADTCEIENLFITDPEKLSPPLTEDEASVRNKHFAEIINELSAALEIFWNRKHNKKMLGTA